MNSLFFSPVSRESQPKTQSGVLANRSVYIKEEFTGVPAHLSARLCASFEKARLRNEFLLASLRDS